MGSVFLLFNGEGDEENLFLISVHSKKKLAEDAKKKYEAPRLSPNGRTHYNLNAHIQEWSVDNDSVRRLCK